MSPILDAPLRMRPRSLNVPAVAAVVVVRHRQLDGHTQHLRVRVPVHTAWQTGKALRNGRYPRVVRKRVLRMGLERVPRPPSLPDARGAPLENTVSLAEPSECLIFHMFLTRAYHSGWSGAPKGGTLTRSRCPLRTATWESGDSHPGGAFFPSYFPTQS